LLLVLTENQLALVMIVALKNFRFLIKIYIVNKSLN